MVTVTECGRLSGHQNESERLLGPTALEMPPYFCGFNLPGSHEVLPIKGQERSPHISGKGRGQVILCNTLSVFSKNKGEKTYQSLILSGEKAFICRTLNPIAFLYHQMEEKVYQWKNACESHRPWTQMQCIIEILSQDYTPLLLPYLYLTTTPIGFQYKNSGL